MSTETDIQNQIRIDAARYGLILWRNNNGVLFDAEGRPVRYGLGNDSRAVNEKLKSSDLIGIFHGKFCSVEVKADDWEFHGTAREVAQLTWIRLIRREGGIACFATCFDDVLEYIEKGSNRHP